MTNNNITERLNNVREYAIQCIKDEADALMGLIPN